LWLIVFDMQFIKV